MVSNPGVVAFFYSGRVRIETAGGSVGYDGGSADAKGIGGDERGMAEARYAVL